MLAICVESSHARGMGHLFRAMRLGRALAARGKTCRIFVNRHEPALRLLESEGLAATVVSLDDSADWEPPLVSEYGVRTWVDDRLDTTIAHARRIRELGLPLVTFDDRGSGAALADLHIAALSFDEGEPLGGRRVLRGVKYLILDPTIVAHARQRTMLNSIVVSMGGSDTYGVTVKVVRVLADRGLGATVIIGPAFAHDAQLAGVLDERFVVKRGVPSLAEEFAQHDLAITGGGITPFEANAAGLPCIVIANEEFEVPVGQALARMGGCVFAGHWLNIDSTTFDRRLPIAELSRTAMQCVDLDGGRRVVEAIVALMAAA